MRVFLNTQAPLTFPGMLSTAGHCDQSSAIVLPSFSLSQKTVESRPTGSGTALQGKNLASQPFTVTGLDNPATLSLAPRGTPLYQTTYGNVAPRVGVAYRLSGRPDWAAVLRGGFGIFYDLGCQGLLLAFLGHCITCIKNCIKSIPLHQAASHSIPC